MSITDFEPIEDIPASREAVEANITNRIKTSFAAFNLLHAFIYLQNATGKQEIPLHMLARITVEDPAPVDETITELNRALQAEGIGYCVVSKNSDNYKVMELLVDPDLHNECWACQQLTPEDDRIESVKHYVIAERYLAITVERCLGIRIKPEKIDKRKRDEILKSRDLLQFAAANLTAKFYDLISGAADA